MTKQDSEAPAKRSAKHPLYAVLASVKTRCYNEKSQDYYQYGDRGITVCPEWMRSFDAFAHWAAANGWQPGLLLSRRDPDGPYNPENCYFRARRDGQRKIVMPDGRRLADVAEEMAMCSKVLGGRIKSGWTLDEALTRPVGRQGKLFRLPDGRAAAEVAASNGIASSTWHVRFTRKGWTLEDAVTVPPGGKRATAE